MSTNHRQSDLLPLILLLLPLLVCALPVITDNQLRQNQQSICNDKHLATAYSYKSVIGGFTNITKALHFTAHFKLVCDKFDQQTGVSYYTISFTRVATKIKTSESSQDSSKKKNNNNNTEKPIGGNNGGQQQRKRKMPRGFETTTPTTTTTTTTISQPVVQVIDKTEHHDPAAGSKDNIWYDMPSWPVKFAQHLNGTIFEIYLKKEDYDTKSEVGNLKKSIILLFQTNRDSRVDGPVVETDDLGTHYSEYAYKESSTGDRLQIHKTVTPDDFLRLQLDSLNAEKLEIFVNQYQHVRKTTWQTELVKGRVATYPIEQPVGTERASTSRNLPFSVEVTYALWSTADSLPVFVDGGDLPSKDAAFVRLPNTNFTSQEYDNSELLSKILSKKESAIKKRPGGISSLVDFVAEFPHTAMKEANLLRSVIGLESKIFLAKGRRTKQSLLREILPLVTKKLRQLSDTQHWDAALKMLYILSSGVGYDIDNLFVELLNDTDLMESNFRAQFLNTLIQFEYPTNRLVSAMFDMLPSSESMSITEHHLSLAISSLVAKDTDLISQSSRIKVVRWFQKMIRPLEECPASKDVYKIFLESVANFLSAEHIKQIGQPAFELMETLVNIVVKCRRQELSVEALNSLRNCLAIDTVQRAIAETLRADDTPCEMRGGLVDALVIAMELSGSQGIARSWPRYGAIPGIDGFILTEWIDGPGTIRAFSCGKQPIARYLLKKKGREWYSYLMSYLNEHGNGIDEEELVPINNDPIVGSNGTSLAFTRGLVRKRRDELAAGGVGGAAGNPFAGLGNGLAGGLSGFVFTPEVDCDNWNSQIGINYTEIYENPVEFDNDIRHFDAQNRHCLFRAEFKATLISGGLKAGFFAGRNERGESKLFGRAWMGVRLLVQMEIAVVQFLREQTQKGFQGHVLLRALSNVYLHEVQYACNLTINDWTYGWQYTTPAFRVTFGGFAFLMNADFDIRFNLTLWPSFCGPDGSMGIRFRPITIVEADAYAELENDFFGLGSLATLYLNYYLDTQMSVPSGCFYLYHGNDDMFFKFDFYLKLPSFVFINFELSPVVLKQPFPVLTWQLMIKKSSRYVLLGWCLPNTFQGPEAPNWEIE